MIRRLRMIYSQASRYGVNRTFAGTYCQVNVGGVKEYVTGNRPVMRHTERYTEAFMLWQEWLLHQNVARRDTRRNIRRKYDA